MNDQAVSFDGFRLARSPGLEKDAFEATNQILMGLTHAMSNILMPLREYPRLIQMRIPENSPAVGLLSNMEIAADRLCEVNNNLIQLCHGNEGTPVEINMVALVQQVVAEVAEQYPSDTPVRVELNSDSAPSRVHGPQDAIYHAVRNICVNAYEAMKSSGLLEIEVRPLEVAESDPAGQLGVRPGHYVMVKIRDHGPGVEPLVRDRLFDAFVTTIRGEGRGLGLSQVYRTVRQLGGEILYQPDCAPGAAVALFLPAIGSIDADNSRAKE